MTFNLKKPLQKPQIIQFQIPYSSQVEAAIVNKIQGQELIVAAVRVKNTNKLYISVFDLNTAQQINTTQQFEQKEPLTNEKLTIFNEKVVFIVQDTIYQWNMKELQTIPIELSQHDYTIATNSGCLTEARRAAIVEYTNILDSIYPISNKPVLFASGTLFNFPCLFIAFNTYIGAFVDNNIVLNLYTGRPTKILSYNASHNCLLAVTDTNEVIIFNLQVGVQNIEANSFKTQFDCNCVYQYSQGYLIGDKRGIVYKCKLYNCSEQLEDLEAEEHIDKDEKICRKQNKIIMSSIPVAMQIEGYNTILASNITTLSTCQMSDSLFITSNPHTMQVNNVSILNRESHYQTMNLGLNKRMKLTVQQQSAILQNMSKDELQNKIIECQQLTDLNTQVQLYQNEFMKLCHSIYIVLQEFYRAITNQVNVDSEGNQMGFLPFFENTKNVDDDFQIFYDVCRNFEFINPNQIMSLQFPIANDQVFQLPASSFTQFNQLTLQSLPFCPGLLRCLSLRYQRGLNEIKQLTESLQIKLQNISQITNFLLQSDVDSIKKAHNLQLTLIINTINAQIFDQIQLQLESLQIHPGKIQPLTEGTIHKYHLYGVNKQLGDIKKRKFELLRRQLKMKIQQIYCNFQAARDLMFEWLKLAYNRQMASQKAVLKRHSNASVNDLSLITFRKLQSAIQNINDQNTTLTGMILKAIDVETSKQYLYLELENRIGSENLFKTETTQQSDSELNYFTVNQVEEVGDPVNGFRYKILLNAPQCDLIALIDINCWILQNIDSTKYQFFTEKQFEYLSNKMNIFMQKLPLQNLVMYIAKKMYEMPQNFNFSLQNLYIDPVSMQFYTFPFQNLQETFTVKQNKYVELGTPSFCLETLFDVKQPQCNNFILPIIILKLLFGFKLMNLLQKANNQKNEEKKKEQLEALEDLKKTYLKLYTHFDDLIAFSKQLYQENQLLSLQNSKFSFNQNDLNLQTGFAIKLLAVSRYLASYSVDLDDMPTSDVANEILLSFMDSDSVPIANWVATKGIIDPYVNKDKQAGKYNNTIYLSGQKLIQEELETFGMSENYIKYFTTIQKLSMTLLSKGRKSNELLFSKYWFNKYNDVCKQLKEANNKRIQDENDRLSKESQAQLEKFNNRSWRGKYQVEYTIPGQEEQPVDTQQEMTKIQQVQQLEKQHFDNAKKNELNQIIYDDDSDVENDFETEQKQIDQMIHAVEQGQIKPQQQEQQKEDSTPENPEDVEEVIEYEDVYEDENQKYQQQYDPYAYYNNDQQQQQNYYDYYQQNDQQYQQQDPYQQQDQQNYYQDQQQNQNYAEEL